MTPELRDKWAAALVSGEYKQAQSRLRGDDDAMCCLGVLCHLVDQSLWCRDSGHWEYSGQEGIPPPRFLDQVGLRVEIASDLAEINDGGETFAKIAQIVRRLPDEAP